ACAWPKRLRTGCLFRCTRPIPPARWPTGRWPKSCCAATASSRPKPPDASLGVSQLPVAAIARNPRQPRARLNPTELEELANSIREHGVIQPLIVAQTAYPGQYTLIAG